MFKIPTKVLYRQPFAETYICIEQTAHEPVLLSSYDSIDKHSGFLFAPFALSGDSPIIVISPDRVEEMPVLKSDDSDADIPAAVVADEDETRNRQCYAEDFRSCHINLLNDKFQKIVLARSCDEMFCCGEVQEERLSSIATTLFHRACRLFPRQFVALVSSPVCGYWLMATPEVLLKLKNREGRSMALAGTMKAESVPTADIENGNVSCWSDKNKEEQQIVARYISDCLSPYVDKLSQSEPHTIVAANVCHLQTDFEFTLKESSSLGKLVAALHPTPAVCGLPKSVTCHHIMANEHCHREYYSGFAGPLNIDDATSLFVSLRCMHIMPDRFRLYAGGGLLRESSEEQEWQETCAKMQAMRKLIIDN